MSAAMWRRGDLASITGPNAEPVEILGGRYVTVGIGATERVERWLRVRFADGGVLLAHPSNLAARTPADDAYAWAMDPAQDAGQTVAEEYAAWVAAGNSHDPDLWVYVDGIGRVTVARPDDIPRGDLRLASFHRFMTEIHAGK